MNGRDNLESSGGLPGDSVETPIAIRAPRVKKDVWLAAAAAVHPMGLLSFAVNPETFCTTPKLPSQASQT